MKISDKYAINNITNNAIIRGKYYKLGHGTASIISLGV